MWLEGLDFSHRAHGCALVPLAICDI